jgi:hypothetical protein
VVAKRRDGDRVIRYPSGRSYLLPVDPVLDHPDELLGDHPSPGDADDPEVPPF